jgi:hypothetical protein
MIINAHIHMCSNRAYQLHIEMTLIPLMVRSMENKNFPTHEHKLAKKTLRDGSNGD